MLRLTVEIEEGTDPIRGTITDARGTATPFVGWVALIDALERGRK